MPLSSWSVKIDHYASVHVVRKQDEENSCGIASILMVNFKQKKHLMAAGVATGSLLSIGGGAIGSYVGSELSGYSLKQAVKDEPEIYKIYSDVTGSLYDGTTYSNALKFPEVLSRLGLGAWVCFNAGESGFFDTAKASTDAGKPVIGHIKWAGNKCAHFVVIDDAHDDSLSVCDPGGGELRIIRAKSGAIVKYHASGAIGTFSGWIVAKVV